MPNTTTKRISRLRIQEWPLRKRLAANYLKKQPRTVGWPRVDVISRFFLFRSSYILLYFTCMLHVLLSKITKNGPKILLYETETIVYPTRVQFVLIRLGKLFYLNQGRYEGYYPLDGGHSWDRNRVQKARVSLTTMVQKNQQKRKTWGWEPGMFAVFWERVNFRTS